VFFLAPTQVAEGQGPLAPIPAFHQGGKEKTPACRLVEKSAIRRSAGRNLEVRFVLTDLFARHGEKYVASAWM
jgi:hypothetical protein